MQQPSSIISLILPFVFIMVIFYFFIMMPEKKRKKRYSSMLEELRVNDEIMTRGGIIGKIVRINDDFVIVESGPDKVKFKLNKKGIANVNSALKENK